MLCCYAVAGCGLRAATGCVLAVSRVAYPYIMKRFSNRYEGVIGVGNRGKKTDKKKTTDKNRVGCPVSVIFSTQKTD